MVLEISSTLVARLLTEAQNAPDREVCGLLFGTRERIERAEACPNVAPDPARAFEIDPAALFAALRAERAGGTRVIGHYHSHPSGAAIPSPRDAAQALGDGAVWLIVGDEAVTAWKSVEIGAFQPVGMLHRAPTCHADES